ncbi:metal-dependent hydrolase family protein [Microvirga brassicacearum]|uniref:Amidohydrolase family protein n=1 Tax=Microvirga brassicacearum TaxID=2580413 RepID=A0A5N3P5T4_9HYPH|nr:amidohydrolase family protein [Microvirga brassicacearum]KAB0265107.1 amidohydrolase family protein [Microvirga brassicacearum]
MFSCTSDDDVVSPGHAGCLCHRPEIQFLTNRINVDLSRRGFVAGMAASVASLGLVPGRASAQPAPVGPSRAILFTNFRLFDGKSVALRDGLRLLVEGNRITAVAEGNPAAPAGAQVIDCGGRVIMPGLIDAHWHTMFAAISLPNLLSGAIGPIYLAAAAEAERTLMRGFTTVRDLGGPVFAFKQAIDEGLVSGPRIYPSGAMITTTGGHADMRPFSDLPRSPGGPLSALEQTGGGAIADSADEVRLRVREQLMQGASQIKLVGGGGVSSPRSPLDMSTFSEAQLRAGVETAADWNTFVTVHAYAPTTIQRAIAAGAKCIEHAHLMDDATAGLMADKGVWLSIQPFLTEDDQLPLSGPSRVSLLQVLAGTDNAYKLARKHKIKTAFGSDLLFSAALAPRQGTMLTHLTRWYSNAEILTMATATNGELLSLSGPRNPYPGKLGVIEDGALADLLLVDGNPVEDISLIAKPDKSLLIIMKDGKIYKDTRIRP